MFLSIATAHGQSSIIVFALYFSKRCLNCMLNGLFFKCCNHSLIHYLNVPMYKGWNQQTWKSFPTWTEDSIKQSAKGILKRYHLHTENRIQIIYIRCMHCNKNLVICDMEKRWFGDISVKCWSWKKRRGNIFINGDTKEVWRS